MKFEDIKSDKFMKFKDHELKNLTMVIGGAPTITENIVGLPAYMVDKYNTNHGGNLDDYVDTTDNRNDHWA